MSYSVTRLDPIIWRARVLRRKLNGELPGLPIWSIARPSEDWNYDAFAHASDTDGEFVLYRTPMGEFCGRAGDLASLSCVVAEGLCRIYEKRPVRVQRGDVVLDLGAHLGTFTRAALKDGAELVVAFEAQPDNAACFQRTFEREIRDGRVVLVQAPVWDSAATVRFQGHGLVGQVAAEGEPMETVTVDGVASDLGVQPSFVKSDIEGAERNALEGAPETLARGPRLAISSYHYQDDPDVLSAIAQRHCPPYHVVFDSARRRMFCHV